MKETLYWISLSEIFGPASSSLWKLMSTCESAEEGYRRVSEGKFTLAAWEKNRFLCSSPEKSTEILKKCKQKGIEVITYGSEKYPSRLRTIFDPPAVLYLSGNSESLSEEMSVSVVGTREPSEYGADAAFRISEELARVGVTIVSGFAAGIDSSAHRGALSGNGKTIAVLGCGVDVDYPRANSDIRDAVMKNGAFISEYPPGTPPLARNFPSRNRIISGLSLGVFVAEAPLSSGALITADCALEQGRDVFCLPPSDIFSKSFQGVVRYLRDGAVPVYSHLDIIYEYYTNFSHKLSAVKPSDEYITARSESFIFSEMNSPAVKKTQCKKTDEKEPANKKFSPEEFEGIQREIAQVIAERPVHIEEISSMTGTDISELLAELTDMEISGAVQSLPGKQYILV